MRTNLILFFCFFLLLNCSKEVELGIDIEQLKNDGVTVLKKINNKWYKTNYLTIEIS